jgi:hypothetical protein
MHTHVVGIAQFNNLRCLTKNFQVLIKHFQGNDIFQNSLYIYIYTWFKIPNDIL